VLLLGPIIIELIVLLFQGVILKNDITADPYLNTASFFYLIDPVISFAVQLFVAAAKGNAYLEDVKIPMFGMDDNPPLWLFVIASLFQTVLYIVIAIFVDHWKQNQYKRVGGRDGEMPPQLPVQQDVITHDQEVREERDNLDGNPYQIRIVDLCKTYPKANEMSVCKNTFGVKKGEVFGLLGPNGAGKTTTFKMVAMQMPSTSGEAHVLNYNVT